MENISKIARLELIQDDGTRTDLTEFIPGVGMMSHKPLDEEDKLFRFFELLKYCRGDIERKEVFYSLAYAIYVILHHHFESPSSHVPELLREKE